VKGFIGSRFRGSGVERTRGFLFYSRIYVSTGDSKKPQTLKPGTFEPHRDFL